MMNKMILILLVLVFTTCEKKMKITDFSDYWQEYDPELRIEAMIYPYEQNVIVRVDRSMNIAETAPFTDHDYNDDGENDIDINYFHVTDCNIRVYHPSETDTLYLTFDPAGDEYIIWNAPDSINPVIRYGAYIPDSLNHTVPSGFFTFGSFYQMECNCPGYDDLGNIMAKEAVFSPDPPVYLNGEDIEDCLVSEPEPLNCLQVVAEWDTLQFNVEYNSDSTTYFYFAVPYGSLNYWVSRYKYIGEDNPEQAEYQFRYPGYMYEYGHEIYPLDEFDIPFLNFSKEKVYVVENEEFNYKYLIQAFSYEYASYIQFSANGLPLYDPIVSNLRDESGNVIMGVLGVSSNATVNAQIHLAD